MISDGWGGIDDAMLDVYGTAPQYCGHGRPPTQSKPGKDWFYLQMIKQRDERGKFQGIELKAVWGFKAELIKLLGKSTAYIDRSNLTTRRKTLAFSKEIHAHSDAVTWEDTYYNWVNPHKGLRLELQNVPTHKWLLRSPAMIAGLTDHAWTVKELLSTVLVPAPEHT